MHGARLALSWLTVLPVPAPRVDERTCRHAISFAPVAGALIGGFGAGLLWVLTALGAPNLLAGPLVVAALVLITRGMHVDGLADTVDGLGCYGPPERALSVMRDGATGPFAVVTLVIVLLTQSVALAELVGAGRWPTVILACAAGRAAFVVCCRSGVPAARPEGMGALVAGSQPGWVVAAWWLVLLAAGVVAVPGIWWLGVVGVGASGAVLVVFAGHVRRRLGGITGDVLGAASELGTTIVLAVCCFAIG